MHNHTKSLKMNLYQQNMLVCQLSASCLLFSLPFSSIPVSPTLHCPFGFSLQWGLKALFMSHGEVMVWSCVYDCSSSPSSYSLASCPRQLSVPWVHPRLWAIEQALFDIIWKGFIHAGGQREKTGQDMTFQRLSSNQMTLCAWLQRMWSRQDVRGPGGTTFYYASVIAERVPEEWIIMPDIFFIIKPIIFCVRHDLIDICFLTFSSLLFCPIVEKVFHLSLSHH